MFNTWLTIKDEQVYKITVYVEKLFYNDVQGTGKIC